ncbi:MAG: hypothetical protein P8R54_15630 [Myxococcota bacterium]|nr:hypothetical protein [Myxococcota bacterium]
MSLRLLVLLVVLLVFSQALWFDFVWDDNLLILENRLTATLSSIPQFFGMDLWSGTPSEHDAPYYRPLVLMDFTLDRVLFGLSPLAHHAHSLLWHFAAVGLAGALLSRLVDDARAVAAGTLLFAVHPVQIEPVVFVAARNDPMAVVFLLSALLLLARDTPGPRHLLGGAVCVLAAALCKESVLLAPAILAGVEWARTGRPGGLRAHLAVAAGIAVYAIMRVSAGVVLPPRADLDHITAALLPVLAHYAHRILVPLDAVPGMHLAWPAAVPWLALIVGVGLAALLVWAGRRVAAAGILLSCLTLAPAIAAIASVGSVPDRYLYLPLLGISLAVAAASRGRRSEVALGLGLLLAVSSASAMSVWQDDESLWRAAYDRWPSAHTAGSLAKVLEDLGMLDRAAVLYEEATSPPRVLQESCYNVTLIHLRRDDPASIVRAGEAARQAGCLDSPELLGPLSVGYLLQCQLDAAEQTAALIGADPTGMAVVVRAAVGLARGDEAPLLSAIAAHPEADPTSLSGQARGLAERCSTGALPPPPG